MVLNIDYNVKKSTHANKGLLFNQYVQTHVVKNKQQNTDNR